MCYSPLPLQSEMTHYSLDYVREAKATSNQKKCSFEAMVHLFLCWTSFQAFRHQSIYILTVYMHTIVFLVYMKHTILNNCNQSKLILMFDLQTARALSHRIISHTTMCFSNLVGPLEDNGFHGHSIAYLARSSFNQPQVSIFEKIVSERLLTFFIISIKGYDSKCHNHHMD